MQQQAMNVLQVFKNYGIRFNEGVLMLQNIQSSVPYDEAIEGLKELISGGFVIQKNEMWFGLTEKAENILYKPEQVFEFEGKSVLESDALVLRFLKSRGGSIMLNSITSIIQDAPHLFNSIDKIAKAVRRNIENGFLVESSFGLSLTESGHRMFV